MFKIIHSVKEITNVEQKPPTAIFNFHMVTAFLKIIGEI
jgi:hypothetical protein